MPSEEHWPRLFQELGELKGDIKSLVSQGTDHGKRIRSLENTRLRQKTISGLFWTGLGFLGGIFGITR